jgi:hypothetical protein
MLLSSTSSCADCPSACQNVTANTGWSVRIMWRRNGQLESYNYNAGKLKLCGDDYPFDLNVVAGQWFDVTLYVKMNTPGVPCLQTVDWRSGGSVRMYLCARDIGLVHFPEVHDCALAPYSRSHELAAPADAPCQQAARAQMAISEMYLTGCAHALQARQTAWSACGSTARNISSAPMSRSALPPSTASSASRSAPSWCAPDALFAQKAISEVVVKTRLQK